MNLRVKSVQDKNPDSSEADPPTRLKYELPEVVEFGSIDELTLGGTHGVGDSGSTPPAEMAP